MSVPWISATDATDRVARLLSSHRFRYANEAELQDGIEKVLTGQVQFEREYRLDAHNRIDFLVLGVNLGIEVKINGSAAPIRKQLERYAKFSLVEGLVLVTGRVQSGARLPTEILGKPLRVVQLLGGLR